MDNTEERYCDGCGAKLSSKNDNYDPDTCGHFCNECFESFNTNYDDYAVDPDFDDAEERFKYLLATRIVEYSQKAK